MKLQYQASIKDGKMIVIHRQKMLDELCANFEGKQLVLTIEVKRKKRSLSQNSYYHKIVVPMVRDGILGIGVKLDLEETHEFLRDKFARKEIINEDTGEVIGHISSTTKLSTVEFMTFVDEIIQWSAMFLNIQIPLPNDPIEIQF